MAFVFLEDQRCDYDSNAAHLRLRYGWSRNQFKTLNWSELNLETDSVYLVHYDECIHRPACVLFAVFPGSNLFSQMEIAWADLPVDWQLAIPAFLSACLPCFITISLHVGWHHPRPLGSVKKNNTHQGIMSLNLAGANKPPLLRTKNTKKYCYHDVFTSFCSSR